MGKDPAVAAGEAVKVNVTELVLAAAAVVSGFADHEEVTPEGRPLTLRSTLPENDPPVETVSASAAELP